MLVLKRHPQSAGGQGLQVEAAAVRARPGALSLRYRVTGEVDDLRLAPAAPPERTDGLWGTTCFEAFVRRSDGGYYEWNLAPSTRWAAYRFDAYREGMTEPPEAEAPVIRGALSVEAFELAAELTFDTLADLPHDRPWRVGLTAVLEDAGGVSYWALAHGPGKPDFHHPDSFALELPLDPR